MGQKYIRLKSPLEFNEMIEQYQKKLNGLNLSKFKTQQFIANINKNLILDKYNFEIDKSRKKDLLQKIKITLPI
jgi:hypothetical protein